MTLRRAALALALGRAALGAALIATPEKVAVGWIGEDGSSEGAKILAGSVGVRDVAIGLGTAYALATGSDSARVWLLASGGADVVDLVETVSAKGSIPDNGLLTTAALAGGSAIVCLAAAAQE